MSGWLASNINDLIKVTAALAMLVGALSSIWSFIATRKKFYSDYVRRKRGD